MIRELDLTEPFIVVRKDCEGKPYEATMGEYLCNPLAEDVCDVEISTGGFWSDEEFGVVSTAPKEPQRLFVPAGRVLRFALSTRDEFDEMVVHWTIRYHTASRGRVEFECESFKGLRDATFFPEVPLLAGPGFVIPRTR